MTTPSAPSTPVTSPVNPTEPSIGRIVHYHFNDLYGNLVSRPAVIVRVWSRETVNLQVFTDGHTDGLEAEAGIWHRPSAGYHHEARASCWSWPPRV